MHLSKYNKGIYNINMLINDVKKTPVWRKKKMEIVAMANRTKNKNRTYAARIPDRDE